MFQLSATMYKWAKYPILRIGIPKFKFLPILVIYLFDLTKTFQYSTKQYGRTRDRLYGKKLCMSSGSILQMVLSYHKTLMQGLFGFSFVGRFYLQTQLVSMLFVVKRFENIFLYRLLSTIVPLATLSAVSRTSNASHPP